MGLHAGRSTDAGQRLCGQGGGLLRLARAGHRGPAGRPGRRGGLADQQPRPLHRRNSEQRHARLGRRHGAVVRQLPGRLRRHHRHAAGLALDQQARVGRRDPAGCEQLPRQPAAGHRLRRAAWRERRAGGLSPADGDAGFRAADSGLADDAGVGGQACQRCAAYVAHRRHLCVAEHSEQHARRKRRRHRIDARRLNGCDEQTARVLWHQQAWHRGMDDCHWRPQRQRGQRRAETGHRR